MCIVLACCPRCVVRCVLDSLVHNFSYGTERKIFKTEICMSAISLTVCRVVFGVLFRSFRVILVSFWSDGCTAAVYFASCEFGFFSLSLSLSVLHVLNVCIVCAVSE